MRVPDYILRCVGFVADHYVDANGESFDHTGTGFFVSIPSAQGPAPDGKQIIYFAFVTAAHVARSLADRRRVALIVNKMGGGVTVIREAAKMWYVHPDSSVDVAVVPVNWNREMDIMAIPVDLFVNQKLKHGMGIGIGDEVYMPGLFTYATGTQRNMPLVRYGNLAMIPDDPIQIDSGFADAYLIEARSIGGMSGSPVFIRPTQSLQIGKENLHGVAGANVLLGLIHGHWDIKESEINAPNPGRSRRSGVNMGIGVVVPSHKILEVLYLPALVEMRREADEAQRWGEIPAPDAM